MESLNSLSLFDSPCFGDSASLFRDGQITFAEFVDQTLDHFRGARHSDDSQNVNDESIAVLTHAGPLGPLAAALKLYILSIDYEPLPVDMMGQLLISSSLLHVALDDIELRDNAMVAECGVSALKSPLLRQALVLSALPGNLKLAERLIALGLPPRPCLFTLPGSFLSLPDQIGSMPSQSPETSVPLPVWAELVSAGWVPADQRLAYLAAHCRSPNTPNQAVQLLQALHTAGFDWTRTALASEMLEAATVGGQVTVLKYVLAQMGMEKPPNRLFVWAVRRKEGCIPMIQWFESQGLDPTWQPLAGPMKELPPGYKSDPRDMAEMSFPGYKRGSTMAAHEAVSYENVEVVQYWINRGAMWFKRDEKHRICALDLAKAKGNPELIGLFKEKYPRMFM